MPPFRARVDLGAIAMKGCSSSIRLFSVISRTLVGRGLTPLQKYSRCILQPQPNGQKTILTVICEDKISLKCPMMITIPFKHNRIILYKWSNCLSVSRYWIFCPDRHNDVYLPLTCLFLSRDNKDIKRKKKQKEYSFLVHSNQIGYFVKRFLI